MTYELYRDDPAEFFSIFLINLCVTLFAYGLFPLLFAAFRKKYIARKPYCRICYLVNLLVFIVLFFVSEKPSTAFPYVLWTWVFIFCGIKILQKKKILDGYFSYDDSNNSTSSDSQTQKQSAAKSKHAPPRFAVPDLYSIDKMRKQKKLFVILLVFLLSICGNYMKLESQISAQLETEKAAYSSLLADYNQLVDTYNSLYKTNDANVSQYNELVDNYNSIYFEYDFYHDYAVIAVENGHNYHKYDCHWIRGKDFYIYNKENAIAHGLEPCYDCYYEDIEW